MTTKFVNTNESQATINFFRNDKLFRGKNITTTNLRKLFVGLAVEIARAENKLQEISDEYDPVTTNNLLTEWEKAIGIPDNCIPLQLDNDSRRKWILIKLTALGVSTKEGFEALGTLLGFNLNVTDGLGTFAFPYVFPLLLANENPKWIMLVQGDATISISTFAYTFPLIFADDKTAILRCLFQELVPSFVKVYFIFA